MSSRLIALCDDLVSQLEPQVLAAEGTIERAYIPHYQLDELGALKVTVVPRTDERTQVARGRWQQEETIDIAVQGKVETEPDDVDDLMETAEALADFIERMSFTAIDAVVSSVKVAPIYDAEQLDDKKLFGSVVRAVFLIRTKRS